VKESSLVPTQINLFDQKIKDDIPLSKGFRRKPIRRISSKFQNSYRENLNISQRGVGAIKIEKVHKSKILTPPV
jgi:hypothetical protein